MNLSIKKFSNDNRAGWRRIKNRMSEISEKMFGRIKSRRLRATGLHLPDVNRLNRPLDGLNSVVRMFCIGCGMYLEATKSQAKDLAAKDQNWLPENLSGYYFEVGGCDVCDGDEDKVKIMKFSDLLH
jgi:hypothetical protein